MSEIHQNETGQKDCRGKGKEGSRLYQYLKTVVTFQFFGKSAVQTFNELEVRANKFVLVGVVMCAILTTISVLIMNFSLHNLIPLLIITLCAVVVVLIFRWNHWWIKYVLIGSVVLMMFLVMVDDSVNLLFVPFLPVLLCCTYFNPRFTLLTAIVMVIAVPVSILTAVGLGYFNVTELEVYFGVAFHSPIVSVMIAKTIETVGFLSFPVILSIIGHKLLSDQIVLSRINAGIAKELSLASSIQSGMLPKPFPSQKEFDVSAVMYPAAEIGGDYYDYFMTDEKHLFLMVADVSGHGIPSSLFLANVKAYITAYTHCGLSVDQIVNKVNRELCASNSEKLFVTAWIGLLNLESGEMVYVNAGHTPPMIMRKGDAFFVLKSKHDFVLGRKRLMRYHERTLTFSEGDRLFLYTDGVTEMINNDAEFFGEKRLLNSLNRCCSLTCSELLTSVTNDLREFKEGVDVYDDVTMLAFEFKERFAASAPNSIEVLSDEEGYEKIMKFTTDVLTEAGCNPGVLTNISVAVSELVANIIMYAYEGKPDGKITFSVSTFSHRAKLVISDDGRYFNPLDKDCSGCKSRVRKHIKGGLGIFMARKLVDDIKYRYENNQNIITIEAEY